MGGAGVWACLRGAGVTLTTVCFVIALIRSSSAYLVRHCKADQDCFPGEFCKSQQECRCKTDFVREPRGACLAVRRAGEQCTLDEQCSRVDGRLACYNGRCGCPGGLRRADGACLSASTARPPITLTTSPPRRRPRPRPPPVTSPVAGGGVFGPVTTCLTIFVSFCALIVIVSYSFRARSRRQEASRCGRTTAAPPDASLRPPGPSGTPRDMPPSYNSLPPPTYEQATSDAAPTTALSSPVANSSSLSSSSSSSSYGSLLTRSFLLTPSDASASFTDLTAASQRQEDPPPPSPPEAAQQRY